jgi:alkylhydroperoxidase/carboxymuconolactone decarboxylase family protein YurZ
LQSYSRNFTDPTDIQFRELELSLVRSHIARARDNGVTEEELVEAITHLALYSGWPNAITAVGVARDVFKKK